MRRSVAWFTRVMIGGLCLSSACAQSIPVGEVVIRSPIARRAAHPLAQLEGIWTFDHGDERWCRMQFTRVGDTLEVELLDYASESWTKFNIIEVKLPRDDTVVIETRYVDFEEGTVITLALDATTGRLIGEVFGHGYAAPYALVGVRGVDIYFEF